MAELPEIYTKEKILERLFLDLPASWDKSTGAFISDEMTSVAEEFEADYSNTLDEFLKRRIETARGDDLDKLLFDFIGERNGMTRAAGSVKFNGEPGADVPFEMLVSSSRCTYRTTRSAVLSDDGTAVVPIECTSLGERGNANVDTVNNIPISVRGIYSVNNESPIRGGSDTETDLEYIQRFKDYYSTPAASGNPAEYEKWAREVDGVGYAKCVPIWNGPGTVKVIIADMQHRPASEELVEQVIEYIMDKKPIGAFLTVESVAEVKLTIHINNLETDASFSIDKIKSDIVDKIEEYLSDLPLDGAEISYFSIVRQIMSTGGVIECGDIFYKIAGKDYRTNYQLSAFSAASVSSLEVSND